MRFVLDNSVATRWLFGDGRAQALDYAKRVLDLLTQEDGLAVVDPARLRRNPLPLALHRHGVEVHSVDAVSHHLATRPVDVLLSYLL